MRGYWLIMLFVTTFAIMAGTVTKNFNVGALAWFGMFTIAFIVIDTHNRN